MHVHTPVYTCTYAGAHTHAQMQTQLKRQDHCSGPDCGTRLSPADKGQGADKEAEQPGPLTESGGGGQSPRFVPGLSNAVLLPVSSS